MMRSSSSCTNQNQDHNNDMPPLCSYSEDKSNIGISNSNSSDRMRRPPSRKNSKILLEGVEYDLSNLLLTKDNLCGHGTGNLDDEGGLNSSSGSLDSSTSSDTSGYLTCRSHRTFGTPSRNISNASSIFDPTTSCGGNNEDLFEQQTKAARRQSPYRFDVDAMRMLMTSFRGIPELSNSFRLSKSGRVVEADEPSHSCMGTSSQQQHEEDFLLHGRRRRQTAPELGEEEDEEPEEDDLLPPSPSSSYEETETPGRVSVSSTSTDGHGAVEEQEEIPPVSPLASNDAQSSFDDDGAIDDLLYDEATGTYVYKQEHQHQEQQQHDNDHNHNLHQSKQHQEQDYYPNHHHHHQTHQHNYMQYAKCDPMMGNDSSHNSYFMGNDSSQYHDTAMIDETLYHDACQTRREHDHRFTLEEMCSSAAVDDGEFDDDEHEMEISPGVYVPFRGAKETWHAVATHCTIELQCFDCATSLVCINDCEFTVCPDCRVVNPVFCDDPIGKPFGVGMGFKKEWVIKKQMLQQQQQAQAEAEKRRQQQRQHQHRRASLDQAKSRSQQRRMARTNAAAARGGQQQQQRQHQQQQQQQQQKMMY